MYRIRRTTYRRFGSVEPADGVAPRYAQSYLFDTAEATEYREEQAINKVGNGKCNPYPILFMDCDARMRKTGRGRFRLILRADGAGEDSRRYNLPGVLMRRAPSMTPQQEPRAISRFWDKADVYGLYTSLIHTMARYRTPCCARAENTAGATQWRTRGEMGKSNRRSLHRTGLWCAATPLMRSADPGNPPTIHMRSAV